MQDSARSSTNPTLVGWTLPGRTLVFCLAATAFAAVIADFRGIATLRTGTLAFMIPGAALLAALMLLDFESGNRRLCRAVIAGIFSGGIAAAVYDIYRVPFHFSEALGLSSFLPPVPFFDAIPRIGATILGQPTEPPFTSAAYAIGWAQSVVNASSLGIMYFAIIGRPGRWTWLGAAALTTGVAGLVLLSRPSSAFGVDTTHAFVATNLTGRALFGIVMDRAAGLIVRRLERTGNAARVA